MSAALNSKGLLLAGVLSLSIGTASAASTTGKVRARVISPVTASDWLGDLHVKVDTSTGYVKVKFPPGTPPEDPTADHGSKMALRRRVPGIASLVSGAANSIPSKTTHGTAQGEFATSLTGQARDNGVGDLTITVAFN